MGKALDLNSYVSKEISCSCGHKHYSSVKRIDIDKDAVKRLPVHISELGYKKPFIVADINTWKAAGQAAAAVLEEAGIEYGKVILDYEEVVPDETVIGEILVAVTPGTDLILGVGSGTLNDLCKLISFRMGLDYIIYATAPSMDGFVSIGSALMLHHVKTTVDCHGPVAVIGDTDVLANAPMRLIAAGLGDTLGKYTCLLDWKMSRMINGEYYCEEVVDMVRTAISTVMEYSKKVQERDPEAIKAVTEALVLTGIAMSFVGNSRPASGCEHHFSHFWEMRALMHGKTPALHGTQVGVGTIVALKLYHMLAEEAVDFDAALERVFDKEAWIEEIHRCYEVAADGIIAVEEASQKNDIVKRDERIAYMKENWPQIQKTIEEDLPKTEEMEALLASLDAPVTPAAIDVDEEEVRDCVIYAKEVRPRFTILQMLWDLGLSKEYGQRMVDYFRK
ncbi:MAG: sn-glycerol-1-phosphate dehydrogenase [Eubacterium sp.]|nr:sn-glycerol-1-phosphate dehydrogenase [Eubacterium sp.]